MKVTEGEPRANGTERRVKSPENWIFLKLGSQNLLFCWLMKGISPVFNVDRVESNIVRIIGWVNHQLSQSCNDDCDDDNGHWEEELIISARNHLIMMVMKIMLIMISWKS